MLQRWMKTVAFLALTGILFTACQKSEFSPDTPLPETFGPLVYTTSQNNVLYALDPLTGDKKWELKLPSQGLQASPVVVGDYLYLAMGSLYKVDAKRGKMIGTVGKLSPNSVIADSFYSTPYVDGNILYLGDYSNILYAYDAAADRVNWSYTTNGDIVSSPTVYQSQVIVANTEGTIYAIDKNTGASTWSTTTTTNSFVSSPTVGLTQGGGNPSIYACGMDGKLYAFDAATGTQKWTYTTGGAIVSSPIAYGGNIVFGSYDYYVYCIDTVAKKERWKYKTGDRVASSPYGDNNVIYVGSYDYNMYALNIIDGTERWKFKSNALIKASPLVHDGTVYVGSFDKFLYAIDTSGRLNWSHNTNGLIESSPVFWDLTRGYYPSTSGNSVY